MRIIYFMFDIKYLINNIQIEMKRNNIVTGALVLTKIVQVMIVFIMAICIAAVIHWHFEPQAYDFVNLQNGYKVGFGVKEITMKDSGTDSIMMNNASNGMIYWLVLRAFLFFIVTFIIIMHIQKILYSVKNIKTFYTSNILHLKKLGYLGIVLFILSCFNFYSYGDNTRVSLTFEFAPLFFAVGCFVLAEILHEGQLLQEDKDQII